MAKPKRTSLEELGAEREAINQQIAELQRKKSRISKEIREIRSADLELSHDEIVQNRGYRAYVGGSTPERWYGIGKHQYHWLVDAGLEPEDVFLDIACGSLRLGQFVIPYLKTGNYFGLDGSDRLIREGLENEILFGIIDKKKPNFSVNYDFDFSFVKHFDVAMAQSLVTHLAIPDIEKLFANLRTVAKPESSFYFTFFKGDECNNHHDVSHPNKRWEYKFETLQDLAAENGWRSEYIGDWQHPAAQMMVRAKIA